MEARLERLNRGAERVDEREQIDRAKRAAAARDLRGRCAPYTAVLALDDAPAPAPVLGLSETACAILGMVAHFVAQGAAGVQVGARELVWLYGVSFRTVWYAIGELREGDWLLVTPDYVPANETKLGGAYTNAHARSRKGKPVPRSLRSDSPEAYANSRVRNLYTLTAKARFERLGERVDNSAKTHIAQLPVSLSSPDSGSSGSLAFCPRPCEVVDNSPSSSPPSSPEIELLSRDERPLVADAFGGETTAGGGDDGSADGKRPRRGLFAAMGSRLRRFLDGGES